MSNQFENYLSKLSNLNRGVTKYGKAPHKPILLITIFELIEKGNITENKILITPELISTFRDNWDLLVNTENIPDFTLPFYHLSGEQFWKSYLKDGSQQQFHIKSFKKFNTIVDCGKFSEDLFLLLINNDNRKTFINLILNKYFSKTKQNYINKKESKFLSKIEDYILKKELTNKVKDEEVEYVRNTQFKKVVPIIYNQTCAFTGMRVESIDGYNFIDACHIIPFSKSRNNSITNGIALNPTLHRFFDRGLITVDDKYKIVVSDTFVESKEAEYSIKKLHGKQIILPFGEIYYPEKSNFQWHKKNIFK